MEAGKLIIKTEIDTKGVDDGLKETERKVKQKNFTQILSKGLSEIGSFAKGLAGSIGGIFSVIGNIAKGLIGTIGKIALKAAGISTALGALGIIGAIIGKAFQKVASENDNLMANIRYLIFAVSQALAPAVSSVANIIAKSINWIINLLAKVLTYIAYIIKAWFGVNILAGVSADAFKNAQESTEETSKNLGKASKNAKELKKQLAGFDEMNVLQDNTSASGGNGGGGGIGDFTMPTLEFGGEVPDWIKWIAENKELVIAGLVGIAAGITAINLGLGIMKSFGIGIIVAGIVLLIQDIIDMINDPSWQNFIAILGDIGIVIGGIMLLLGSWWGLLVVIIGLAVKLIAENWDTVKSILGTIGKWIKDHIITPVANFFTGLWNSIITEVGIAAKRIKDAFNGIVGFFGNIVNSILNLFRTIGTNVGNVIVGAFKGVVNGVLKAVENILNSPIRSINRLIDTINAVPGINLGRLSTFSLPRLAKGGIINMPGKGVAVGGERGAEGVIPLTDSQQMALLGEAIGRYITVNASIINTMNGRVISRELQKIQNESDFAFNR